MIWTPGVAPTSSTTWTISVWLKKASIGEEAWICGADTGGESTWNNGTRIYFNSSDQLRWYEEVSGSVDADLFTNRFFRDPAAWYHLVFKWDTTNGSAGDRMKIFVNGVEETSFATDNNPDSSRASVWGTQYYSVIGQKVATGSASNGFSGVMTHFQFADGTAYDASTFGSTDATSGIWKINISPTVTYGTNGFFIMKDAWSGTDESPNSNNWTPLASSGTTTADNPANKFASWDPIFLPTSNLPTFQNGSTTAIHATSSGGWRVMAATLGVSAGKWYWECIGGNSSGHIYNGVCSLEWLETGDVSASAEIGYLIAQPSYGVYGLNGALAYSNTSGHSNTVGSYVSSYDNTDYASVYLDLDNNKIYWSINGTIQNSGTGYDLQTGFTYMPALNLYNSDAAGASANFGNGTFGNTALTGTTYSDNDGIGTFKYSPNYGGASTFDGSAKNFMALCTKNIKAYG